MQEGEASKLVLCFDKLKPRKFYIRRNKNEVNSIETGCTVIAHLFSRSDKRIATHHAFLVIDDKTLSILLYL